MAEVCIRLSESFAAGDREMLSACVSEGLQNALGLPFSAAFFRFEGECAALENCAVWVDIQLFPAGSARMRRTACMEIVRLLSEQLQIPPEQVEVRISAPPQERKA